MGARDAIAKTLAGIKAFHSSPHDFDKFDLKKIGTGEGAQVYGHGLYFAENPAVSGQGGQYWNSFQHRFSGTELNASEQLRRQGFDRDKAIQTYTEQMDALRKWNPNMEADELTRTIGTGYTDQLMKEYEAERALLASGRPVGPRTYEVNINADPARFLNWDKPLDAQPHIADALREIGYRDAKWPYSGLQGTGGGYGGVQPLTSGEDVYRSVGVDLVGPHAPPREIRQAATGRLQDVGIPGVKYLDEGSRGVDKEIAMYRRQLADPNMAANHDQIQQLLSHWEAKPITSNYVVFDPANVDILKKYGVVGAPAGTIGMGALAGQDQYEAPQ